MDGGERFPLNKLKIHLKDGKKSRIFMRYYKNEEKREIEKTINEIINQEGHIKKGEQFIQKQEADDYDDLYD